MKSDHSPSDARHPFTPLVIGRSEKVEHALSLCCDSPPTSVSVFEPDKVILQLIDDQADLLLLSATDGISSKLALSNRIRQTPELKDVVILFYSRDPQPEALIEANNNGVHEWIDEDQSSQQIAARIYLLMKRQDKCSGNNGEILARDRQQLYRDVVNSSPDGIFVLQDGKIQFLNPGLIHIAGFSHDELLGSYFSDHIDPEDRESVTHQYLNLEENGLALSDCRFRIVTKNKRQRWVKLRKIQRVAWCGETAYLCYLNDITRRKKRKEAEIQSEKMVSVGCLAAGIAHEINNPLAGVIQSAQNIIRRLNPNLHANHETAEQLGIDLEKTNLYLQQRNVLKSLYAIRESGEHAAKIVRNMHHFVRKNEAEMVPTNPNQLIRDTIHEILSDASLQQNYHSSAFNFNVALCERPPSIPCMPEEIRQVLHNLLCNAVQSTHENREARPPEIQITSRIIGKELQIEIEDNGEGIHENTKNRVFEPFFTTKSHSNMGIGLSIAYMIITYSHDGKMELESDPSWGTRFTICLPLDRPPEPQPDTSFVNFFGNLN